MSLSAYGQESKLYHTVFSKQDGLDLDIVSAMAFDNDGFLWIGGVDFEIRDILLNDKNLSIQRFDGENFHTFTLPENKKPITFVRQIFKRKDGLFYIIGDGIFSLFNPVNKEFTLIPNIPEHYSPVYNYKDKNYVLTQVDRIITLQVLHDDLSLSHLFSFTSSENRFVVDGVSKIVFHEKGVLISDDNFPLMFFDWKGELLKRYSNKKYSSKKTGLPTNYMIDEVLYKKDKVYAFILNNQQLHEVDFENLSVIPVKQSNTTLNEETIYSYGGDDEHLVLHTLGQDLNMSTLTENGFSTITARGIFNEPYGIKCASTDIAKEVWVGTSGGELHYFKFPSKKIDVLLPRFEMRAIVPLDQENYMVCTERDGWFVFNEKTKNIAPYDIFVDEKKIYPNSSRNILIEKDTLWFHGDGINFINRKTRKAVLTRNYPVSCFEPLNEDVIIYGTKGYHLMSFNKRTLKHDSIIKTDSLAIYDLAIHDNIIIGATDKGVLRYNVTTKQTDVYADETILGDKYLLMVDYQEPFGFVFGSRDGTISSYNEATKNYSTLYKDELKAGIAKIVYDDSNWWISTFNGLVHYNIETKNLHRYSTKDGLSHNEGNRYSGIKTEKGILIGSIKGLNYFNPDDLKQEEIKSQLQLLRVSKYDFDSKKIKAEFNQDVLNQNTVLTLPAEHKELELYFGLTNNVTQNENSYRYRLNTNDWIDLRKEQAIRFVNLAPGSYKLEIEAQNFSGIKIGRSLMLQINSKEFFYKKWWFFAGLSFIAIAILLYLLKESKLRQSLQQNFARDLISSQEQERKRIAKDLHDSVGQRLTLIKRKTQNQEEVELTVMTNDVLEEVRSISRGLYPANLKALGLTESIRQLAYEIDEQTDLFMTLELENIDLHFNDEGKLNIYRFVQESFSNILKHAKAKEVSLLTKISRGHVIINIDDNGVGFLPNEKRAKNSLGLKTLEERISVINGKLEIISKPNSGTQLIATIPIK